MAHYIAPEIPHVGVTLHGYLHYVSIYQAGYLRFMQAFQL